VEQDIAYPTDLNLLSDAREKLEELIDHIDHIYTKELHQVKPRTYREVARKKYLQTAQKKNKSRKVIRKANRCQLNFVKRDIAIVNELLDVYQINNLKFPFSEQTCALGAAMYAAVVAGIYPTVNDAQIKMGHGFDKTYNPIAQNVERYQSLYNQYTTLGNLIEKTSL
jgi:hypothetical protein